MKSHKRGYTLATTLLIMVLVFGISAVMVALVASQTRIGQYNSQSFEKHLQTMQISTNFVNMPIAQFDVHYQGLGFTMSTNGEKTTWFNADNPLLIVVEEMPELQSLWVVDYGKGVSLANVQKTNGQVVKYSYEERDFEL